MKSENAFIHEELLDHFKFPRHKKKVHNPDFCTEEYNPSCGDQICIEGRVENGVLVDLGFSGRGCIISQATASLLLDEIIGKTCTEIMTWSKDEVLSLVGLQLGPNRLRCALLSLHVIQKGLKKFLS